MVLCCADVKAAAPLFTSCSERSKESLWAETVVMHALLLAMRLRSRGGACLRWGASLHVAISAAAGNGPVQ